MGIIMGVVDKIKTRRQRYQYKLDTTTVVMEGSR
jgi:hypothetical protein